MLSLALRGRGLGESPLEVALVAEARAVAERSLASLLVLRDVAAALDAAQIPWLSWKGPALAVQAWSEPSVRSFNDLDLIVAREDRQRARAALVSAGWRARHHMSETQERAILLGSGAIELQREDDGTFIELHWRFASPRFPSPLDPSRVIANADRVAVANLELRTPAGADALILLALHGTKHGWSQAEEVVTFTRLAWKDQRAVEEAVHLADVTRCGTALGLALALAERLAGLGLCTAARALAHAPRVTTLADACIPRMCAGDAGWRPDNAWSLSWMDRRADRARYLIRALLSPTMEEWKWLRLPDVAVAAYPVVRLVRLALRRVAPRR